MSEKWLRRAATILRWILPAAALLYPAAFVLLAIFRAGYPFQLEWMEGGTLTEVARILSGRGLYVAPTVDFTPFVYAPLYYYVGAAAVRLFGLGFAPLRLVSTAAAIGSGVLIYRIVRRETGTRLPPLLAAGLFAGTYPASGDWFDLARVDMLFLFLLLLALHLGRPGGSNASLVSAAVALTGACLTKQIGLVAAAAMAAHFLLWERRRAALFLSVGAALLVGVTLALNRASGGWYRYYVFALPGEHAYWPRNLVYFWTHDLLGILPVAAILAVFHLLPPLDAERDLGRRYWAVAAAGLIAIAYASRVYAGSFRNVLIPAFAAVSLLFGFGLGAAFRWIGEAPERTRKMLEATLLFACLVQFAALFYDPRKAIPRPEDRAAGERLARLLTGIPGRILIPAHSYLLLLAGRPDHLHQMAMNDILLHDHGKIGERMASEMRSAIRDHRFAAVILDDEFPFLEEVRRCYREVGPVFPESDVFWPQTGWQTRPRALYLPREDGACGDAPPSPAGKAGDSG